MSIKIRQNGLGVVVATVVGLAALACNGSGQAQAAGDRTGGGGGRSFSGPYSHDNLSVLLVHGPDRVEGEDFVTLQEALDGKLVTVHETGNVGELAIENHSTTVSVFIQSGDIVKGGRQDRTLAYDVVVPPRSGKMPIKSFCVEQGRWSGRSGEDAGQFSSNTAMLASKRLKLAAKDEADQGKVWAEVAETQTRLSESLDTDVRSGRSQSSLQLTLENRDLAKTVQEYTETLADIAKGKDDVIGFAFAINGEVNSADVYASSAIFTKLWPKLLESAVVEAIGERQEGKDYPPLSEDKVQALMEQADESTSVRQRAVTAQVDMKTRESGEAVVFETVDKERGGTVLHKNYITKD